jgi:hypothetical protein
MVFQLLFSMPCKIEVLNLPEGQREHYPATSAG